MKKTKKKYCYIKIDQGWGKVHFERCEIIGKGEDSYGNTSYLLKLPNGKLDNWSNVYLEDL